MARPLSLDLRERIAAALASGETTRAVAQRGTVVTPDTVWRCLRRLGLSFKKNTAG